MEIYNITDWLGLVPIFIMLIFHFFICVLARKFMFARYLLTGKPVIVISPNGINYKEYGLE